MTTTLGSNFSETYKNAVEEVERLRSELKNKLVVLKDMQGTIYTHMDKEKIETYAVGEHTFNKKETAFCPWNKRKLKEFAENGSLNLSEYEEHNTNMKVVYSSKKNKVSE